MEMPKAPKDPALKGSSFYICRQKEIYGGVQPDGSGIQFIYLDGVRLVSLARMVGGVTDEAMLENLKSAEKFRDMVAGIGVAVEAEPGNCVGFSFQFYGKKDMYGSGTTLTLSCQPDGREQVLWMDDYGWTGEEAVPGQMRFHFLKPGGTATVDVKLYLREGYEAPEQEERFSIDYASREYADMLDRSLVQTGNVHRLKNVLERAKAGEEVTIAFIGGSITQGAGATPIHRNNYAYLTYRKFQEHYGKKDNVRFIKAGIGGTPSELGMIRFERDLLEDGKVMPDLTIVEFAVNDGGDETKGKCYEGIVRRLLSLSEHTAVVLLFAVFADDGNLQERLEAVGYRYELPMVSIRDGVVEQFYKKPGEGRVLSKAQFFYDAFHPANPGHLIMSDCLMRLFREAETESDPGECEWRDKEPVYGAEFTLVHLLDRQTNTDKPLWIKEGSFQETDRELQAVERDADNIPRPQFPYNWMHVRGNMPFRMKINCRSLLLVSKDSGRADAGKAVVMVDGSLVRTADSAKEGWTHCNAQLLFMEKPGEHLVEIAMAQEDEEKLFTILGFGYIE